LKRDKKVRDRVSATSTIKFTKGWPKERFLEALAKKGFKPGDFVRNKDVIAIGDPALGTALARLSQNNDSTGSYTNGLKLLGFKTKQRFSDDEILSRMQDIWPLEKVQEAYAQGNPSLLISIKELQNEHRKLFRAMKYRSEHNNGIQKRKGKKASLQKQINRLYPEFPNLYNWVSSRAASGNQKDLGERLRAAFQKGTNIAPRALRESDDPGEKKLYREVYHAGKGSLGFRTENPKQTIARLTGLKPKDFMASNRTNDLLREITENATKLVFLVTYLIDPTGKYFQNGFAGYFPPIRSIDEQVKIDTQDEKYIVSDFMVASTRKNCVVEVKSGTTLQSAKGLTNNYQDWPSFETDGTPLDSVVAVLQMNQRIVAQMRGPLSDLDIKTVSGEKFMEYFSKAIDALGHSPYHAYVAGAVHGVHSLANIYRFHEQIVFQPHVALKPNRRELLMHHNKVLSSLTKCLEKAMQNTKP